MMKRLVEKLSRLIERSVRGGNQQIRAEIGKALREIDLRNRTVTPDRAHRNPLNRAGACFFSQNDEDGILLEILRRIGGNEPSLCLEIGVGDGLVNNTLVLLAHRWRAIWIGGEPIAFDPSGSRLVFEQKWVTAENIVEIAGLAAAALGKSFSDIRVASVDLDGNDHHVVQALLEAGLHPEVFVVEYNAKFPPTVDFVMPNDPDHRWAPGGDYFGASLKSWVDLMGSYEYQLVACNTTGANAFFVRRRHLGKFADVPTDIGDLFSPGSYRPVERSGWPLSPDTARYLIRAD